MPTSPFILPSLFDLTGYSALPEPDQNTYAASSPKHGLPASTSTANTESAPPQKRPRLDTVLAGVPASPRFSQAATLPQNFAVKKIFTVADHWKSPDANYDDCNSVIKSFMQADETHGFDLIPAAIQITDAPVPDPTQHQQPALLEPSTSSTPDDLQVAISCRETPDITIQGLGLTVADIVKITAYNGGSLALAAIIKHAPALQDLGIKTGDIVKIAANNGGLRALEAVVEHISALRALRMGNSDIVKIASKGSGSNAIAAVIKHIPGLHALGIKTGDIVKMFVRGGGSNALAAVIKHAPALQDLKIETAEIVKIAAHNGGSKALAAVIEHTTALKELGIYVGDIVKIAANSGGAKALVATIQHAPALQALGLKIRDIARIASYGGAAPTLQTVAAGDWQTILDKEALLKLVCCNSGSNALRKALSM